MGQTYNFERMAITPEQIEAMDLPTRATKRSDPRSKGWGNKPSVELDALPAPTLRELVRECIERHLDSHALAMSRLIEQNEKVTLAEFRKNFVQGQNSDWDEE